MKLNTKRYKNFFETYVDVLCRRSFDVVLGDEEIFQKLFAIGLQDAVLSNRCTTLSYAQEMTAEIDSWMGQVDPSVASYELSEIDSHAIELFH